MYAKHILLSYDPNNKIKEKKNTQRNRSLFKIVCGRSAKHLAIVFRKWHLALHIQYKLFSLDRRVTKLSSEIFSSSQMRNRPANLNFDVFSTCICVFFSLSSFISGRKMNDELKSRNLVKTGIHPKRHCIFVVSCRPLNEFKYFV